MGPPLGHEPPWLTVPDDGSIGTRRTTTPLQPGASVADAYDRWAASYDGNRNATRDLDAAVVRLTNLPLSGAEVLELGCGTGKNTAWLAQHARRVIGMDVSDGMLSRAQHTVRAANVEWSRHDIRERWPIPNASVDLVIGNLVLEHVEQVEPIFREAARVLRPGGTCFVCELHPFRQLGGSQAQFTDERTGERVFVTAHVHTVSEFVNGALAAGLELAELGEWTEPGAPAGVPPRLLSLRLRRPAHG